MYRLTDEKTETAERFLLPREGFFLRLTEQYGRKHKGPVSVIGPGGEVLFGLEWEEEYYLMGIGRREQPIWFIPNFRGEDLLEDAERLDDSFLSRFDTLWFEDINEFSWQIIRLVNRLKPGIRVMTGDERAVYFPDISVEIAEAPEGRGAGRFCAGHVLPVKRGDYSVYSLMLSLTWCRKRHCRPDAPDPRTVLRIDFAGYYDGWGDLLRRVSAYVYLARVHGWEPVVCLDHGTQYGDEEGQDCWSTYFQQPGELLPEQAGECACLISVYENRPGEILGKANPYLWELSGVYRRCLFAPRLRREVEEQARRRIPQPLLRGERVLGLVLRASDYDVVTSVKTDRKGNLRWMASLARKYGYTRFFLATEEAEVLEEAREVFGDGVMTVDQKRVRRSDADSGELLSERLGNRYASKFELSVDYLTVIAALSCCEMILANRYCGALYLADALSAGFSGKAPVIRVRLEPLPGVDAEALLQRVDPGEDVILYGAGKNGRRIRESISLYVGKTRFCDVRAAQMDHTESGCEVFAPEDLDREYRGEKILVTPAGGREEIRERLLEAGIPDDRILV